MTHDELLKAANNNPTTLAVVQLHKPVTKTYNSIYAGVFSDTIAQQVTQDYCEKCHYRYPCNTIRAIEKELK